MEVHMEIEVVCYTHLLKKETMLSALLKSGIVLEANIKIMNSFVKMRNFLPSNKEMFARLDKHGIKTMKNR